LEKTINKLIEELLENGQIIEPPVDVEKIAKLLNIIVVKRAYKDKGSLSAMLVRNKNKVIIGINEEHNIQKQRFSIAHEIGHFFLHKGEELIIDKNYSINFRHYKTNHKAYLQEKDANNFASRLLIPEEFLIRDLKAFEIDELTPKMFEEIAKNLQKKYNVSLISMRLRLLSLLH
jgi:Zn-dependent peptidase ImmA (M78 family)